MKATGLKTGLTTDMVSELQAERTAAAEAVMQENMPVANRLMKSEDGQHSHRKHRALRGGKKEVTSKSKLDHGVFLADKAAPK